MMAEPTASKQWRREFFSVNFHKPSIKQINLHMFYHSGGVRVLIDTRCSVRHDGLARIHNGINWLAAGYALAFSMGMNTRKMTMQAVRLFAIVVATGTEVFAEDRRIVVSIPDRKIALLRDGHVVKVYPIAVGKHSTPSPSGSFHIASRVVKPTWYQPGKVVPAGSANPLGTRWMGLGYKGYGIHGTNRPRSIGKAASHGCIRMRNQDVEDLFERIEVGDPVELVTDVSAELAEAFEQTAAGAEAGGGQ